MWRTHKQGLSIVEFADNPDSAEFKQAVQDNRHNKQLVEESEKLIQRILDTMF